MELNQELANQLGSFLAGDLALPDYRQAMMRFRLEKLASATNRDKNFVYEFETRYAQLQRDLITELQFNQLLTYAAAADSAATFVQAEWFFYSEPMAVNNDAKISAGVSAGTLTQNQFAVA